MSLVVAACGGDDEVTTADMGAAADTGTATDSSTAVDSETTTDMAAADDASDGTADAATADAATADDASTLADAATAAATWGDVHSEFRSNCTPCHSTSSSGGHQMAQTDAANAYADSQLSAANAACTGLTKGACAALRVRAGTMPPGGLSSDERVRIADIIDSWVDSGEPGPAL